MDEFLAMVGLLLLLLVVMFLWSPETLAHAIEVLRAAIEGKP